MAPPRFWRPLIRLRHVIRGSLTLGSLNLACRDHVPTFPQRSPPSLLTTAACGGLRSTPDCRPRRTYLHLSYSYAAPCGPALLVTQSQLRPSGAKTALRSIHLSAAAGALGRAKRSRRHPDLIRNPTDQPQALSSC